MEKFAILCLIMREDEDLPCVVRFRVGAAAHS